MRKPDVFERPGVNPQNMDPGVSGDTFFHSLYNKRHQYLVGVVDGAYVPGFSLRPGLVPGFSHRPGLMPDIARWSSQTISLNLIHQMNAEEDVFRTLPDVLRKAISAYCVEVADLKVEVGYSIDLPPFYKNKGLNPLKIGPQSAFVVALFNPDSTIEIAQVRDCLAVAEMADGTMRRLTPNQSEQVEAAGKVLGIQNEKAAVNHYQSLAKEIIVSGAWASRCGEIAAIAQRVHREAFYGAWSEMHVTLPEDITGPEGFALWLNAVETLCLCYNSATFNNNLNAPEVLLPDGAKVKVSWAMFTGEEDMLSLTHVSKVDTYNMRALWLMSDGAFKQGDRGEDLKAMRHLGPEQYYQKVLLPRFDGSTPGRKRYHDERVPMDVTIVRIPLI